MQPKCSVLFIKPTASNIHKMKSVVVLALGLMTTTFALPVIPEGQVPTGIEGVPQTHVEVPGTQVEKTGFQGSSEVYTPTEQVQQNTPVPKVENVPVGVENTQTTYTESPVLLPIQPLSVVPVNQVGQVFRPVIVPAEAIIAGRVIIMGTDPSQQRSFTDVVVIPEKQAPFQQIVQPAVYTPVQTQGVEQSQQTYVQPTEKQTSFQQIQPNHVTNVKEQTVQPVGNYNAVPQVYNVQPVVEQQVPVHTQSVEPSVQRQQVQKQVPYQQPTPVQLQEYQQVYTGKPVVVENVEKQGSQQVHNVQQGQQVRTYIPVQNQQVENIHNAQPTEQVYNVQPVEHQVHNVQPTEQQVYNVQPTEQVYNQQPVQQVYNPQLVQQQYNVQPAEQIYSAQPVEQVHNVQPVPVEKQTFPYTQTQTIQPQQQEVQQTVEKYVPQQTVQTGEYIPVQTHAEEPVYQQQVYNAAVGQVQHPVQYQQVTHQQAVAQDPEQITKTTEVQSQQIENYSGQPAYNFGDKLPQAQQNPVHTQTHSVQPSSVLSVQE